MIISNKNIKQNLQEPKIVYRPTLDNLEIAAEIYEFSPKKNIEIPWDALSDTRKKVVYSYIYEKKDFETIARMYKLWDASEAKREFYYALTTLSEFGTMRLFLDEKGSELTPKQLEIMKAYYVYNFTQKQIAEEHKVGKTAVQNIISRVIKKYNITWQVFVKKKGRQLVYNTPEIFK